MSKVFGIDLGTTYSAISAVDEFGRPEIYRNVDGDNIIPSAILFDDEDTIIVGKYAAENAAVYKDKVVRFVKREMGKSPEEFSREFFGVAFSAPQLSAIILKSLAKYAGEAAGEEVKDVVITVPAYFDNKERNATIEAAEMADLNVLKIINEPTAAALTFGIDKSIQDETLFVFDLGGGTFDISIVKIQNKSIRVVASDGDHKLGGIDWDNCIIKYVSQAFMKEHNIDPSENPGEYQDILNRINRAKHNLSTHRHDKIQVHCKDRTLNVQIKKERFEALTKHLVYNCEFLCKQVLNEAKMSWGDIDQVLMVGGSTRMPMIKEMVKRISGKELNTSVNPDEVVAVGAAYQAIIEQIVRGDVSQVPDALKEKLQGINIYDVNTHTLGCMIRNPRTGKMFVKHMLKKNETLPCENVQEFTLSQNGQRHIELSILQGESNEPDECVELEKLAMGPLPANLSIGTPVVVKFSFNTNNTLDVSVECAGQQSSIQIKSAKTHTDQEKETMKRHLSKLEIE